MSVYVGVMSGTSLDGIDVAVVTIAGSGERPDGVDVIAFESSSYPASLRDRIRDAIDTGGAAEVCELDFELGRRIGAAVSHALAGAHVDPRDVAAIGSHGQTVWHVPPEGDAPGSTLQIGNPSVIAESTGVDVVSDFRSRDMAAGGHGAPLTAYTDRLLFSGDETRLIQNIGGIANVTVLPPRESDETPAAFDTGPGVALIDGAVRDRAGEAFDEDGRRAARGRIAAGPLAEWLADPYFARRPPKSTGREHFSTGRLRQWMDGHPELEIDDIVATLTELTARTIADAYAFVDGPDAPVYLCGGGSRNPAITGRLLALLAPRSVHDLAVLGVDPDAREAIAFALLARQHDLGLPANASWATGAVAARRLGSRTPA
ncbi:MAG: anhydro-N-acetylmuramic acid kinase [Gemmatimonadota bacterium]|nr:anhydro-N-acetylmuramic acid kinase [Gemmatimonadota bacterium]